MVAMLSDYILTVAPPQIGGGKGVRTSLKFKSYCMGDFGIKKRKLSETKEGMT